ALSAGSAEQHGGGDGGGNSQQGSNVVAHDVCPQCLLAEAPRLGGGGGRGRSGRALARYAASPGISSAGTIAPARFILTIRSAHPCSVPPEFAIQRRPWHLSQRA